MKDFIKTQYELYKMGMSGLTLETIHRLADKFLSAEERIKLFSEKGE